MEIPPKLGLALVVIVAAVVAAATTVVVGGRTTTGGGDEGRAALVRRVEALERKAGAEHPAPREGDRTVLRRIEAIEARLPATAAAGASPEPPAAGAAIAAVEGDAAAGQRKLHEDVVVGLTRETASDDHRAAVARLAEHLVKSAGPPLVEGEFMWAAHLLDRESRRGRITVKEAEELEPRLFALPAEHVARPRLAAAVAIGWGRDPRLGGLLSRFATNSEPTLHEAVLAVLDDEHPGTAFSEYVLRIVREEKDSSVLAAALGLDVVEAAATAAVAPRLVQAIETRVMDGGLDADTRTRAGLAVAVASLKDPPAGVTVLRRLAARETDAEIAERYTKAAGELQLGTATLKSLERLFE